MDAAPGGELAALRSAAQLLHRPAALDVVGCVRHLLAVQAQDIGSARLALRARVAGATAGDVDRALTAERSLVVGWLGRGTLHLVHRDDYLWLLGLTAPRRHATSRRRLRQEGVPPDDAERAVRVVADAVDREGPLSREALGQRLAAAGIRTAGQALPHLLLLAALRGVVVLGPVQDGRPAFAPTRGWLGAAPRPLDGAARERALAELARRYLAGHGPAAAEDLATWSGLPVGDARAGLAAADGVTARPDGLLDLRAREPASAAPPPRLLPAYDPLVLGWRDRSQVVAPEDARRVHPGGGTLRPTALVDGRVAGTWNARRTAGRLRVRIEPFAPLAGTVEAALADEAEDVARFEGRVLLR